MTDSQEAIKIIVNPKIESVEKSLCRYAHTLSILIRLRERALKSQQTFNSCIFPIRHIAVRSATLPCFSS